MRRKVYHEDEATYVMENLATRKMLLMKIGFNQADIKTQMLISALYKVFNVHVPLFKAYHTIPLHLARAAEIENRLNWVQISEYLPRSQFRTDSEIAEVFKSQFLVHLLLGNFNIFAERQQYKIKKSNVHCLWNTSENYLMQKVLRVNSSVQHLMKMLSAIKKENRRARFFSEVTNKDIIKQLQVIISRREQLEKTVWRVTK